MIENNYSNISNKRRAANASNSKKMEINDLLSGIEQRVESGGIYDISTTAYTPAEGNVAGADTNMTETGVQNIPRDNQVESL